MRLMYLLNPIDYEFKSATLLLNNLDYFTENVLL